MYAMRNKWILCIDDHQDICSLIASVLRRLGFTVLTAQSCDDALTKVQTVKFALYLINCEMSDGGVRDLYDQIRGINLRVPIIFTSAANIPKDLLATINTSRNYFLSLPFELPELEGKVSKLLR
jgi:CheY-like chemotaxis protein